MKLERLSKKIVKVVIAVAIFSFIIFAMYFSWSKKPLQPQEFTGPAQEKWIAVQESKIGSQLSGNIMVKLDSAEQLRITIEPEIHNQIETGMRIKRDSQGKVEIAE